ncbi:putative bifunctional diguanylate cyclase/phosphodiesterase [Alkaliphilus crotonatoxidans]
MKLLINRIKACIKGQKRDFIHQNSRVIDFNAHYTASRITIIYFVLGVSWILLSDKILLLIFPDSIRRIALYQTLKGWSYMFLTAAILYFIIKQNIKIFETARIELKESYEELETTHEELIATEEELREKLKALNQSQSDLKQIEERYRLAIEGSNDGIWDWDLKNNTFVFDRTKVMLGYKPDEIENVQSQWFNLVHPSDLQNIERELKNHFEKKISHYRSEYRVLAKNGEYRWILSRGQSIWDQEGNLVRMAGSHTDITETKGTQERIRHLAYIDPVTGLYNRFYFIEQLEQELINCRKNGKNIAVLLLDLDDFKKTIDTLGHSYGDLLLHRVGEQIKACLDDTGTLCRFGGDEFVILKPIEGIRDAVSLADKILESFKMGLLIKDYESFVSTSIGLAVSPFHGTDAEGLLKNVEVAMYEAKEKGKNCYYVFNDRLKTDFMEKAKLETDLRHAIDKKELIVYYQPKIDLRTNEVVGGEALIRWLHPLKGLIGPSHFISLAEENGMIRALGEWVLREVCRQNKKWQESGLKLIPLAVNISARQFQQKDLVKTIRQILTEVNLEPHWLELEVTETVAMQDLKYTIRILNELRKMNISIALDDFGTGYSSLNYLKHLPINTVKIDKSFVHDIHEDSNEAIIADAIISMAHGMRLTVTAEGVETREQLIQLKKKHCDFAQGYYFYKPIPPEDFEILLRKS